jgi:hypothetical protein
MVMNWLQKGLINSRFNRYFYSENNNVSQVGIHLKSRVINFGRQGHSLTQSKMLHRKTVVNVITYHHVV